MGFPVVEASGGEGRVETQCGEGVGMWGFARLHPPSTTTVVKTQPEAEGGSDSGKNTKPKTGNLNSVFSFMHLFFFKEKKTHI